jgi:uncharacterized tellurite resistance protein B-like protein
MTSSLKLLIKILIGAAWIDGRIQPEERDYLHRLAKAKGVADDPEIRPLLYELRSVKPEECYQWLQAYLGNHPTDQDYQTLIEEISAVIYSDGAIALEEARLLNRLQQLETPAPVYAQVLSNIRSFYKRCISQI